MLYPSSYGEPATRKQILESPSRHVMLGIDIHGRCNNCGESFLLPQPSAPPGKCTVTNHETLAHRHKPEIRRCIVNRKIVIDKAVLRARHHGLKQFGRPPCVIRENKEVRISHLFLDHLYRALVIGE